MALDILMPQLGLTMKEGLISEWRKKQGQPVTRGEVIFCVENDKAIIEVQAQADGVLAKILVEEMATVPVGTVVGVIASPGEAVSASAPAAPAAAQSTKPAEPAAPARPISPALPEQSAGPIRHENQARHASPGLRSGAAVMNDGFVLASPLARRQAESQGLDLGEIPGTGPQGAVLARDLAAAPARPIRAAAEARKALVPTSREPLLVSGQGFSDVSLSRVQRVSAERLSEAWASIPQFTVYDEAEAGMLLDLAARFKKAGSPVSLTVILAKFLGIAAERHPKLNASWLGTGAVRLYDRADINIAMDTSEGLMVPVLRDCASRGFLALGADMADLAEKARSGSLGPDAFEGGTITLSNLGMFGISRFGAIINPPQTAILAVGRIYEKVVAFQGSFAAKKYIEYSVTADHRVVDGAEAARFLSTFKALVENPLMALD